MYVGWAKSAWGAIDRRVVSKEGRTALLQHDEYFDLLSQLLHLQDASVVLGEHDGLQPAVEVALPCSQKLLSTFFNDPPEHMTMNSVTTLQYYYHYCCRHGRLLLLQ